MTLKQFLEKLSMTSGWRITPAGYIRRPLPGLKTLRAESAQCPVTAVLGERGTDVSFAYEKLGMSEDTVGLIVSAADFCVDLEPNRSTARLRNQLLKACGLQEKGRSDRKRRRKVVHSEGAIPLEDR
jgi:hypothetical protein